MNNKFFKISNKILQWLLIAVGVFGLLFLFFFNPKGIFFGTTFTLPYILFSIAFGSGDTVPLSVYVIFSFALILEGSFAVRKKRSHLAFVCCLFFICDILATTMHIIAGLNSGNEYFNMWGVLMYAVLDPLIVILFVIYFIGIFKEKRAAKLQSAKTESISE